jgi:hypothetical protein
MNRPTAVAERDIEINFNCWQNAPWPKNTKLPLKIGSFIRNYQTVIRLDCIPGEQEQLLPAEQTLAPRKRFDNKLE